MLNKVTEDSSIGSTLNVTLTNHQIFKGANENSYASTSHAKYPMFSSVHSIMESGFQKEIATSPMHTSPLSNTFKDCKYQNLKRLANK